MNKRAYPFVDIESLVLDWDNDVLLPKAAAPFDLVMYVWSLNEPDC